MSTDPRTVLVDFLDADTGQVFARTDITASRLPERFRRRDDVASRR